MAPQFFIAIRIRVKNKKERYMESEEIWQSMEESR
jgi:hypothetical protein